MMPVIAATKTVVAAFDRMEDAQNAVRELESSGFSRDEISVIANKNVAGDEITAPASVPVTEAAAAGSSVAVDAGIGAALGGVGGLLLSFAGLAIPGVGPVLALGPIVAALSGAGIGAVAGGLIGALTASGIPEEEAHHYAEGVRRGSVLVTVKTDEAGAERARSLMDAHGAVDVEGRASAWRQRGWTGHNPGAEPLSADELKRERQYFSAADRQAGEWKHDQAHDIGTPLTKAEAQNASVEPERRAASRVYDRTAK